MYFNWFLGAVCTQKLVKILVLDGNYSLYQQHSSCTQKEALYFWGEMKEKSLYALNANMDILKSELDLRVVLNQKTNLLPPYSLCSQVDNE